VLRDNMWAGQPAFIFGGGPSVLVNYGKLPRVHAYGKVIAVNRSIELPLYPDLWIWLDKPLFDWILGGKFGPLAQARGRAFRGIRVTKGNNHRSDSCACAACMVERDTGFPVMKLSPPDPKKVQDRGWGLGLSISDGVRTGNNTGYWAINLAYCLGCNPIVLFGYDCNGDADNNQTWWHDGYAMRGKRGASVYNRMRSGFEEIAKELAEKNIVVYNVSPGTSIKGWPVYENLDDVLGLLGNGKQRPR